MARKISERKAIPEEWRNQLKRLENEYPLVLHSDAGRAFSMVSRMKAEKELAIPIKLRSGFAISTKTGKAANKMTQDEWVEFYRELSARLRAEYPDLHQKNIHRIATSDRAYNAMRASCAAIVTNDLSRSLPTASVRAASAD